MKFAASILTFFKDLKWKIKLPDGVEVMNPFENEETMVLCRQFYHKFYNDNNIRWMIIGINPGRFGGGVTGIPFTDPIRLDKACGIKNHWPAKQELSSLFIYDIITAFGGVKKFYDNFYITSVSPLGFTKDGKNLNYYDDRQLQNSIKEFVIESMRKQLAFGINRNVAFCLGDGKNFKYLSKLNEECKFFDKIIPLSHPRFVMQYKLKMKGEYMERYMNAFDSNARFQY